MTLVLGLLAGVMCFVPGIFLLDYLTRIGKLRVSKTEAVLLGSVVWNFGWVSAGYIVAILTTSIGIFYEASLVVGFGVVLVDLYQMVRVRPRLVLPSFDFDRALALVLIVVLGVLLAVEIFAHTIYQEFDALFFYLPTARSIVLTGGLHFDPLHVTGFTTTVSPALPLMYGSVLFFAGSLSDFGTAVRVIPLVYVALTALAVYLLTNEVFSDSRLALVSSMSFLSLPVLMTMSLNYALYLDFGFVFVTTVSLYLVARVWRQAKSDSFTWAALGISFGLSLLVKDVAYFIVPALFILAVLPRLRRLNRSLLAFIGALVFTGAYDFFFVHDALFPTTNSELGVFLRQTTIFGTFVLVFLILRRMNIDKLAAPSGRQLMLLILPFAPGVMYILRNLLQYRLVSFDLNFFNAIAIRASDLVTQSGRIPTPPLAMPSFQNLLQVFSSYNGEFLFLLPLVLGIVSVFPVSKVSSEGGMIICLFVLVLIDAWGWLFNFAYTTSEVRHFYELAPVLAVLAAAGIGFVSRTVKIESSMVIRFVFFDSLALLYLWTGPLNISSSGVISLSFSFEGVNTPTLLNLLILSVFFVIAFIPIPLSHGNGSVAYRMATGALLLLLIFPVSLLAYPAAANSQTTSTAVSYPGWERHLSEVIDYVNANMSDNNYTIVTFYALHMAYFTNHSIIDMTEWYGVATLLPLVNVSQTQALRLLTQENVRYLLVPNENNAFYEYYLSISMNMTFLSPGFISNNPDFLGLYSFTDYTLYQILLP